MSDPRTTPPSSTATNARTALVTALELGALVAALALDTPVWAAAAVAGAAVTGTLVRAYLLPRPEWWAIALIPIAAVLCGFAAIGVEETFSDGAREYVVIAEVAPSLEPFIPDANFPGDECGDVRCELQDGDTVEVTCFLDRGDGRPWAKLGGDEWAGGGYLPARFLARKGESAPICGDTGTPSQ